MTNPGQPLYIDKQIKNLFDFIYKYIYFFLKMNLLSKFAYHLSDSNQFSKFYEIY